MADNWKIVQDDFDLAVEREWEGIFSLGSGYLQIRGSLEEQLSDCPQNTSYLQADPDACAEFSNTPLWGSYVPGIYGKHPIQGPQLLNLPCFLDFTPVVEGEKLDLASSRVSKFCRSLNLKSAVLRRELCWKTRAQIPVNLVFERFVSAARPAVCLQRVSFSTAEELDLRIFAGIDADVRTNGYDHFVEVAFDSLAADEMHCEVETDLGETISIHSRLRGAFNRSSFLRGDRDGRLSGSLKLPAGKTIVVEKRSAVATSRDRLQTGTRDILRDIDKMSWSELVAEHKQEWAKRWAACEVTISGDPESQRAIRLSLYHLLRAHVPHEGVSIDPTGYTCHRSRGRFSTGVEMHLLPFYLYTAPDKARTLVDFRVSSLQAARELAGKYGSPGAKYPVEADPGGRECACEWHYRDHKIHVTADVSYALCHYAAACDHSFMKGAPGEVILETARYWMSRLSRREGDENPSLLGVMGPDTYAPISHNNAYTNTLARFNLQTAAHCPGASVEEQDAFREAAATLPLVVDEDGLILQSEDFGLLAEPEFDRLWLDSGKSFASQVPRERRYRSKCLEQADVLMMMALFVDDFSQDQLRSAWQYYLPYTTHDSPLSAGIHACIAARLGLDREAWELWRKSAIKNVTAGEGHLRDGVPIGACGNNWMVLVMGFAGFQTAVNSAVFRLNPRLPRAWKRLQFPIRWQGIPLQIKITPKQCCLSNDGNGALDVIVWNQSRRLEPGETIRITKAKKS